jgi:hypothetical protein
MASIAVSLAETVVLHSNEIGRSVIYSRHNHGSRTLPYGMPALTRESSVYPIQPLQGNISSQYMILL